MLESKTSVVDKKRRVDEVDAEIVKLCAFAETGFQHWIKRVQGDYLARRVSALMMEWQKCSGDVGRHGYTSASRTGTGENA